MLIFQGVNFARCSYHKVTRNPQVRTFGRSVVLRSAKTGSFDVFGWLKFSTSTLDLDDMVIRHHPHQPWRIHGIGIFTYMNGWFLWWIQVNIHQEHGSVMGKIATTNKKHWILPFCRQKMFVQKPTSQVSDSRNCQGKFQGPLPARGTPIAHTPPIRIPWFVWEWYGSRGGKGPWGSHVLAGPWRNP